MLVPVFRLHMQEGLANFSSLSVRARPGKIRLHFGDADHSSVAGDLLLRVGPCPAGEALSLAPDLQCVPCKAGEQRANSSSQEICVSCDAGRYSDHDGAHECLPCSARQVAPVPRSSSCRDCVERGE